MSVVCVGLAVPFPTLFSRYDNIVYDVTLMCVVCALFQQEHHECKLRVEKLHKESQELRNKLAEALRDNRQLATMITNHKQKCPMAF